MEAKQRSVLSFSTYLQCFNSRQRRQISRNGKSFEWTGFSRADLFFLHITPRFAWHAQILSLIYRGVAVSRNRVGRLAVSCWNTIVTIDRLVNVLLSIFVGFAPCLACSGFCWQYTCFHRFSWMDSSIFEEAQFCYVVARSFLLLFARCCMILQCLPTVLFCAGNAQVLDKNCMQS